MDQILSNCLGVLAVHDNVTVYGANDAEHDATLFNLMRRSQEPVYTSANAHQNNHKYHSLAEPCLQRELKQILPKYRVF